MKKKQIVLSLIITLAGSLFFAALTGFARGSGTSLLWAVVLPLICAGLNRFFSEKDRRAKGCFFLTGAGLMLTFALERRLSAFDRTGWDGLAFSMLTALCWGPAAGEGLLLLVRRLEKLAPGRESAGVFWKSFLVIVLGWLPVWLSCFPCIFGYDLGAQLQQVLAGDFSTHHPLMHTLLVGGLYLLGGKLGSYTLGAFLYAALQAACLAGAMAYALSYLADLRCPRGVRIALTIFFAIAPNHSVLAIGTTKDVLFAAAAIVAAVEIHQFFASREKSVLLVLSLSAMCLLRNNALMAVLVWLVPAFFMIGRQGRRRLLAVAAAALVVYGGISFGLEKATNASKGSINEMLSVPAQQISRVYTIHGVESDAGFEALEWVPHAERYQPFCADNVKLHLKVVREGELMGFLKFWLRELFHYPIEYIDAFLLNSKGYWSMEDTSFASVYGQWPEGTVGALIIEQYSQFGVNFQSFLPQLRSLYEWLFSRNCYQSIPGLSLLIHPAAYTWMLITLLAWAVWRKNRAVLGMGALLAVYLLTLFLGPCALVRYCYYLMSATPVGCALMLCTDGTKPHPGY